MRAFILQIVVCLILVSQSTAGNFPVQNYGNDFMNGFNQSQGFIQRQRQIEQMDSDRKYQQRMLKIEEQRLEIERGRVENEKRMSENSDKQIRAEWAVASVEFHNSHPEYLNNNDLLESLKAELKTIKNLGEKYDTLESKVALLEKAHQSLKKKEVNINIWKLFITKNPAFSNINSKQRKYGDYLYETEYGNKVTSGEISYTQALDFIATETYKVIGKKYEVAPVAAPAVEVPRFVFETETGETK